MRKRQVRSFLVAMCVSLGAPMLLAGCPDKDDKAESVAKERAASETKTAPQASQAAPAAESKPREKDKGGW